MVVFYGISQQDADAMANFVSTFAASEDQPPLLSRILLAVLAGLGDFTFRNETHGSGEWLNVFVHAAQRRFPDQGMVEAVASLIGQLIREAGQGHEARIDTNVTNLLREAGYRSWQER
jgi:hypothetical protein